MGFHKEINFEIEFYISKPERRRGYAKEACIEIINLFFTEGLSIDNKIIKKGEIYVVTLTDNIATIELLIKLGFKRYVSEEGETVTMRIFFDEDVDEILSYCTSTYVLKRRITIMKYYISDLHLFHKNVTGEGNNFDNRPFDTLEEMHKYIKEKWNRKITNGDTVYILGDVALRGINTKLIALVVKLKGNKILIKGNHDDVRDLR